MRWLITRMIMLGIVLGAAIGVATWNGNRQPLPDAITALHLTACEPPCWIGIIPGKTTLAEADQRLKNFYDNQPDYKLETCAYDRRTYSIVDKVTGRRYICVWFHDEQGNGVVNQIRIDFDGYAEPLMGDLIAMLGQPTSVSVWYAEDTGTYPVIVYKNHNLVILYEDGDGSHTTFPLIPTLVSRIYLDDSYSWDAHHQFPELVWSGFQLYRDVGRVK